VVNGICAALTDAARQLSSGSLLAILAKENALKLIFRRLVDHISGQSVKQWYGQRASSGPSFSKENLINLISCHEDFLRYQLMNIDLHDACINEVEEDLKLPRRAVNWSPGQNQPGSSVFERSSDPHQ
jgi:hypothetical protein